MYDYTGCQCSVCHQEFQPGDDIVVCPDCGAPYHRACYEYAGGCVYSGRHGEGFEWAPPHKAEPDVACPRCGTANPSANSYCRHCGAPLKAQEPSAQQAAGSASGGAYRTAPGAGTGPNANTAAFDYESFYRTPYAGAYRPGIDPNEKMEDIPAAEWATYIGPSSRTYLNVFKQMELMHRKHSVSLSAMLFGPFYFFYRKAWKPAFIFMAAELLLNIPSLLTLLQVSGSALAPALSPTAMSVLSWVASIASFVLMVIRGLYGFYFYKKSAAERIRRIEAAYPDPEKRSFVLSAQGGISIAAVVGAFIALMVLGSLFSLLLGPDLEAVLNTLYL